jgi:hypothetical protein
VTSTAVAVSRATSEGPMAVSQLSTSGHDANLRLRGGARKQFHQQSVVVAQFVAASQKVGERGLHICVSANSSRGIPQLITPQFMNSACPAGEVPVDDGADLFGSL